MSQTGTRSGIKGRFVAVDQFEKEKRAYILNNTDLRIPKMLLQKDESVRISELIEELGVAKACIYAIINKWLTPRYVNEVGRRGFCVGLAEEGFSLMTSLSANASRKNLTCLWVDEALSYMLGAR